MSDLVCEYYLNINVHLMDGPNMLYPQTMNTSDLFYYQGHFFWVKYVIVLNLLFKKILKTQTINSE